MEQKVHFITVSRRVAWNLQFGNYPKTTAELFKPWIIDEDLPATISSKRIYGNDGIEISLIIDLAHFLNPFINTWAFFTTVIGEFKIFIRTSTTNWLAKFATLFI